MCGVPALSLKSEKRVDLTEFFRFLRCLVCRRVQLQCQKGTGCLIPPWAWINQAGPAYSACNEALPSVLVLGERVTLV